MFRVIKAVAFNQYRAALFHRAAHHQTNFLIQNRVANGLMTGLFSEVGGYSMPGVQGEELAFNKCHQIVGQLHACDGRQLAFELSFIDNPLAEGFHGDFQRIVRGGCRRRHDTVNGRVNKTDVAFHPGFVALCERVKDMRFQLAGAAHHVFTGDDIERALVALRFTQRQTFGNRRSDALQYHRANGGRHEIDRGDKRHDILAGAVNRIHAGNGINLLLLAHHAHLIAVARV